MNAFPEQSPSSVNTHQAEPVSYGGFWRRFLAMFIDNIILDLVCCLMGMGLGVLLAVSFPNMANTGKAFEAMSNLLGSLLGMVACWLYFALLDSSEKQATLGKLICGLQVTDTHGQRLTFGRASGRFFGKYISCLTCFIGYIMAAFTERKQALHDIMAGTLVIKKQG